MRLPGSGESREARGEISLNMENNTAEIMVGSESLMASLDGFNLPGDQTAINLTGPVRPKVRSWPYGLRRRSTNSDGNLIYDAYALRPDGQQNYLGTVYFKQDDLSIFVQALRPTRIDYSDFNFKELSMVTLEEVLADQEGPVLLLKTKNGSELELQMDVGTDVGKVEQTLLFAPLKRDASKGLVYYRKGPRIRVYGIAEVIRHGSS